MKPYNIQIFSTYVATTFALFACIMQPYALDLINEDVGETNLIQHILVIEADNPAHFIEFDDIVQSWYAAKESNKPLGNRPEMFAGILRQFAGQGPETNMVSEGSLYSDSNGFIRMTHKNIIKYSDTEVLAGKRRNRAARMAVLKHVITRSAEDGQYEQNEFLDFLFGKWGGRDVMGEDDYVDMDRIGNFDEIVTNLMKNEKLSPSARIKAALYLRDANGIDVLPVLRGIVTNLPPEKPSSELLKSLKNISGVLPEAGIVLKDIEKDGSVKTSAGKNLDVSK